MNNQIYNNWKIELKKMNERHQELLRHYRRAGIGVSGNIQIELEELEIRIIELGKKIEEYEGANGIPISQKDLLPIEKKVPDTRTYLSNKVQEQESVQNKSEPGTTRKLQKLAIIVSIIIFFLASVWAYLLKKGLI